MISRVAGGVGGGGVLSSGGAGSGAAGGCRESERLEAWKPGGHFLPSLGSSRA